MECRTATLGDALPSCTVAGTFRPDLASCDIIERTLVALRSPSPNVGSIGRGCEHSRHHSSALGTGPVLLRELCARLYGSKLLGMTWITVLNWRITPFTRLLCYKLGKCQWTYDRISTCRLSAFPCAISQDIPDLALYFLLIIRWWSWGIMLAEVLEQDVLKKRN
jgi:hypothetical protein